MYRGVVSSPHFPVKLPCWGQFTTIQAADQSQSKLRAAAQERGLFVSSHGAVGQDWRSLQMKKHSHKNCLFLLLHLTGFESDLRTFWKKTNDFLGIMTCHEGFSSWADTKILWYVPCVLGFGAPGSRDFWSSQHHTFKKLRWKALRIVHLNHFNSHFWSL